MPRYFFDIAYNGTAYHGWQVQENAHTVQAELENCLSTLLRKKTQITGSGRTDTGVHARRQIIHLEMEEPANRGKFIQKLNGILPKDISVSGMAMVKPDAHARFDAIERGYEYHIHQTKSPFLENMSYFYAKSLNVGLMNEAARLLPGEKDFESFSKVKTEVNTFICTVKEARWEKQNDSLIFHITANRFLRGMVRALAGTLLEAGRGRLSATEFADIIASKDRQKAGRAVPAHGLYLTKVVYPDSVYQD